MSFNIWWTKEENKIVGQYEEIFIFNAYYFQMQYIMLPIAIHMAKKSQKAQKNNQKVQKDQKLVSEKYVHIPEIWLGILDNDTLRTL